MRQDTPTAAYTMMSVVSVEAMTSSSTSCYNHTTTDHPRQLITPEHSPLLALQCDRFVSAHARF